MVGLEIDSPVIVIDGASCRLSRFRLGDYQRLERRFAASRPDPLTSVRAQLDGLPEPLQRQLLELAFDATLRPVSPTVEEMRRWLLSIDGMSAALEIGLRDVGLDATAEWCRRVVYEAEGLRRDELLRVVESCVGMRLRDEGELGNDRGRGAETLASAANDATGEPDWIGRLCATD